MDLFKVIKKLSEAPGPSGYEAPVVEVVKKMWSPYFSEFTEDNVGSLIAIKHGSAEKPRHRILLAAHLDEIGLMAKNIVAHPDDENGNGNGFIGITNVGGVDRRHLYGQLVVVHGSGPDKKKLTGIVGALPRSMQEENKRTKSYDFDELVVDVGLPISLLKQSVNVGDFISFSQPLRKLLNNRVTGKAFDNRVSAAALVVCLEYLQNRRHDWDVIFVATAQEETGLLGAFTSAYSQRPDVAIALDVTFGKGPSDSDAGTFELGDGPAVGLGPNVHPGIYKSLLDTAKGLEMIVHTEPHSRFSGTDAFGLQIAREGIPTGLISVPLRYMHTMVETVALTDIERVGRLIGEFITRLDENFLDDLAKGMMEE